MKIEKPKIVEKVWGNEIWMANTELYCGKLLSLNKGKRCSLHYHEIKDETFYIYFGKVLMELGNKANVLIKGDSVRIKPNTKHRFSGLERSILIETSTHHKDDDSYRIELSGDVPKEIMRKYK